MLNEVNMATDVAMVEADGPNALNRYSKEAVEADADADAEAEPEEQVEQEEDELDEESKPPLHSESLCCFVSTAGTQIILHNLNDSRSAPEANVESAI